MSDVEDSGSTRPQPAPGPPPAADPNADLAAGTTGVPEAPRSDSGYSWTSSIAADVPDWAALPPFGDEPVKTPRRWPIRKSDLLWAGIWAAVAAVLGAPLAYLWVALGPHVDVVMTAPGQPDLADYNTEAFVAGDGRYALIATVVGAVLGATAWLLRRGRGPLVVVGLALGSLAGAWITWKLGTRQGAEEFKALLHTAKAGQHFQQNMRLRATGLVYLQALVAVAVYVGCAAWSRYPDLSSGGPPPPDGFGGPPSDPAYAAPGDSHQRP